MKSITLCCLLLSAAILLTALVQTGFLFEKYLSGKTTVARSVDRRDVLAMPAVTFCPGFKKEEVERREWLARSMWEWRPGWKLPESRGELDWAWKEATFGVEEILEDLHVRAGGRRGAKDVWFSGANVTQGHKMLEVSSYDTTMGRCHSFHLKVPMAKTNTFDFYFVKGTQLHLGTMAMYLHEPWAYVGLNDHFFPGARVTTETVRTGVSSDIGIFMSVRVNKAESGNEETFADCVMQVAKSAIKEREGSGLCYFPTLGSLLDISDGGRESFAPCANLSAYVSAKDLANGILSEIYDPPCPEPASINVYSSIKRNQLRILPEGRSQVNLYVETTDVFMEEEYVLLDFGALAAAVGGLVGMFLGWSLLDLVAVLSRFGSVIFY